MKGWCAGACLQAPAGTACSQLAKGRDFAGVSLPSPPPPQQEDHQQLAKLDNIIYHQRHH
jgi:hypothetical protein